MFFRQLPSNSKHKVKRIGLYIVFIFTIIQPLVPCATAVLMSLPSIAIHRLSPIKEITIRTNKNHAQIATIPTSKIDKIKLTNNQIKQFNNLTLQLNNGSIKIEKAIFQLIGGNGLTDVAAIIAFVIFMNWYDSLFATQALQANALPHQDLFGWLSNQYDFKNVGFSDSNPTTYLEMEKPISMPQQEYSGMTKSEKRQLPDPIVWDRSINIYGYPRLDLRFNQVKFKMAKLMSYL